MPDGERWEVPFIWWRMSFRQVVAVRGGPQRNILAPTIETGGG